MKPATPKLTVEDLVPALEELPKGFRVAPNGRTIDGETVIKLQVEELKKSPPPFMDATVIATMIETSEELKERAIVTFEERAAIALAAHEYATVEAADKAFHAIHRAMTSTPVADGIARQLHGAGRFVVTFVDRGATPESAAAFEKALVARLAKAGDPKSERFPAKPAPFVGLNDHTSQASLSILEPFLPAGVHFVKDHTDRPWDRTTFAEVATYSGEPVRTVRAYRHDLGWIIVAAHLAPDDKRFAEPSRSDLARFRHVWLYGELLGRGGVSLEVRGDVPADVVAWFVKDIERELARSADGKNAKRFDAPPAWMPRPGMIYVFNHRVGEPKLGAGAEAKWTKVYEKVLSVKEDEVRLLSSNNELIFETMPTGPKPEIRTVSRPSLGEVKALGTEKVRLPTGDEVACTRFEIAKWPFQGFLPEGALYPMPRLLFSDGTVLRELVEIRPPREPAADDEGIKIVQEDAALRVTDLRSDRWTRAKLEVRDKIVGWEGAGTEGWDTTVDGFLAEVAASKEPVTLHVERDGKPLRLTVPPR
jgi:hypothetical protein